jgi:cell division protein ZapE
MLNKLIREISFSPDSENPFPLVTGLLTQLYNAKVARNHLQHDDAQLEAVNYLQQLLEQLVSAANYKKQSLRLKWWSAKPPKCRSVYIFGGVGRGKSMLMEMFYEACPLPTKRRVHFNAFMLEVHAFIHECRFQKETDAISALAKQIKKTTTLLCFDEFHVTDIADAMILGRLFSKLFDFGVTAVMTSNRHPSELYQGGLQREQFLFFIKILQGEAEIIELAAQKDFRLEHLPSAMTHYYFPLDQQADEFVQNRYQAISHCSPTNPKILSVLGRPVYLASAHNNLALASFDQLCVDALGAADYREISNHFDTLIITNIPQLTADKRNEAKRFVTLIDTLYEHKVKLICTAEVPAHELYNEGDGSFEFGRTVSRLVEMQSDAYLRSPHRKQ